MPTGSTGLAGARIGVSLTLAAALVCGCVAHADPTQDEQFLTLLQEEQIPALEDIPALIARAHDICGEFDGGASFQNLMDEEMNTTYSDNPTLRLVPGRVARTAARFITASVDVYCPRDRGKLPPL